MPQTSLVPLKKYLHGSSTLPQYSVPRPVKIRSTGKGKPCSAMKGSTLSLRMSAAVIGVLAAYSLAWVAERVRSVRSGVVLGGFVHIMLPALTPTLVLKYVLQRGD